MIARPVGSLAWLALCLICAVMMVASVLWRLERGDHGRASLNVACAVAFLLFARRELALLRRDSVSKFEFPLQPPRRFPTHDQPAPGKPTPSPPKDIYDL